MGLGPLALKKEAEKNKQVDPNAKAPAIVVPPPTPPEEATTVEPLNRPAVVVPSPKALPRSRRSHGANGSGHSRVWDPLARRSTAARRRIQSFPAHVRGRPPANPIVARPPSADPVVVRSPSADPVVVRSPSADPVVVRSPSADPVVVRSPSAGIIVRARPADSPVAPAAAPKKAEPEKKPEPAAARVSLPPSAAVLMLGGGYAMQTALSEALRRHGLHLETEPADAPVDAVVATGPDLILLVGDAARDGGREILGRLSGSPLGRSIPTAILADRPTLAERLKAFRHGAAAVIRRTASVDEIAEAVTTLARQVPDREGPFSDSVNDVTLEDLMTTLSQQLRTDVLSIPNAEDRNVRLVLSEGRQVAELIDEFAERLRKHVVRAEQLEYEFGRRSGVVAQILGSELSPDSNGDADIQGLRVAIADDDPARADAIAHELRSGGATVLVTDLEPSAERFQRLRQLDPIAVMIGDQQLEGSGISLVRRIRTDLRLRWASLVVVGWDDVWPLAGGIDRVLGTLAATAEPERTLRERVESGRPFDVRLESLGPARLLRALCGLPSALRMTLHNPRLRVRVDVSESLIAGATGESYEASQRKLEGYTALAALLVVGSGRAHVELVERPATVNVMSPADVALEMADAEEAPIAPSARFPIIERPSLPPPPERDTPSARVLPPGADDLPRPVAEPAKGLLTADAAASPAAGSTGATPNAEAALQKPSEVSLQGPAENAATLAPPQFIAQAKPNATPRTVEPVAMNDFPPDFSSPGMFGRRVSLPVWVLIAGLLCVLGGILAVLSGRGPLAAPETRSEPSRASAPAPDVERRKAKPKPLIERARGGDDAALRELTSRSVEKRSVDEALAIVEGQGAQKRRGVAELAQQLKREPKLAKKQDTIRRLLEFARDADTTSDALTAIAEMPGALSADLLFDIFTRTPGRTRATEVAEQLLQTGTVRSKASPGLLIALDLRRAKTCEEFAALLPRARQYGDKRALAPLGKLIKQSGCGPNNAVDCFACLRNDTALNDAVTSARVRHAPKF